MRTWIIVLSTLAVGVASGFGLTWREFAGKRNYFQLRHASTATAGPSDAIPVARVVDGDEFDFGVLGAEETGHHEFFVRNDGNAPLRVRLSSFSCGKCVQTTFREATLEPGETVPISVEYATRKPGPQFYEYVELATDDPERAFMRLVVRGYVVKAVRSSEEALVLGNVSTNEPAEVSFRVYGYLDDQLEVKEYDFSDPEFAQWFDARFRQLEPEELAEEQYAKVGYEVTVVTQPGLPPGPVKQTMRLTLAPGNAPEETLEIPIEGRVAGDIQLLGSRRLVSNLNLLSLGTIPRSEGMHERLRVMVKGPHRDKVDLKITSIDPEGVLRAELGEPQVLASGAIRMYPLDVEVIKNAPVVNRLGTKQAEPGVIVIETTHPLIKEVRLQVRFATE